MMGLLQFFAVLLAAFGLVGLGWLALGALLLPGGCAARMVVDAKGPAEGLEQTVKAMLWLRRTGLWRGEVVIEDCGLDEGGAALARTLAQKHGVLFTGDIPDRVGPVQQSPDVSRETSVLKSNHKGNEGTDHGVK